MTLIDFTVTHQFAAAPKVVWDEMIDWESHSNWIPATRIELHTDNSQIEGATFTGFTGYGKLTLVDRMRISKIDWDEAAVQGTCEVKKLGPVLQGQAGFTVSPNGDGATVDWIEQVTVRYLPRLLAPIVSKLSALGFSLGMRRLAKVIKNKQSSTQPHAVRIVSIK